MTWRTRKILGRPWQDITFAGGQLVLLVGLAPLLWSGHVPPFTGISTAGILWSFAIANASYSNWMAATMAILTGIVWFALGLGVKL